MYYKYEHWVALGAVALWLLLFRVGRYPWFRRVLVLTTGLALVGHFAYPLMPPRMRPDLGFVDTGVVLGQSVYGPDPRNHGLINQYAAMPSMHVAWAVLFAVTVILATRTAWRWLAVGYPAVTTSVVVITGNHYWLDGDRRRAACWRSLVAAVRLATRPAPEPEPAPSWLRARVLAGGGGWPGRVGPGDHDGGPGGAHGGPGAVRGGRGGRAGRPAQHRPRWAGRCSPLRCGRSTSRAPPRERATDWRSDYLAHFRRLVEAGLPDPKSWLAVAESGLAELHRQLRLARADGTEDALPAALTEPAGRELGTVEVARRRRARARAGPAVPRAAAAR